MTDWDLMTEYIHNAMHVVDKAHVASRQLRENANPETFDNFRAQLNELTEHLTQLQTVLNNQEANINIGDQIPIITTYFNPLSTGTTTGFNQSSVQFRDTGIILSVVPRVNPGGLVFMELSQEVSKPGANDSANASGNASSFSSRSFQVSGACEYTRGVVCTARACARASASLSI